MRALLTGATRGIGQATARLLCPLVDILLLHGLEPSSDVEPLMQELRRMNPFTEVAYLPADFGRLTDAGALVAATRERVGGLELLINNAGRPGAAHRTLSTDGHELTWQTNYLAPVVLTSGLLPVLERGEGARVINVTSTTHLAAQLDFDDLELENGYSAISAYTRSQLAIVTYTCWLAGQLEDTRVEAISVHPGFISTTLAGAMFGAGGDATECGARNLLWAAQQPPGVNGTYFDQQSPARPHPQAVDVATQGRLLGATIRALDAAGMPTPRPADPDRTR